MSDLKHKTPAELRAEITSISRWRAGNEMEAREKEELVASLLVEASQLRQRAHNMGQREAFDVAAAWGFKPVSVAFVWDKGRMGMGYWTRQEVEICHLFKRGKPARLSKGVRSLIRAPRREHSRKPDEQYERIEALVGGPYLELFARQSWRGWASWGNEPTKYVAANDNQQEVRACA